MSGIEWRPIPGFEGYYEASSQGEIRSVDRVATHGHNLRGKIRAPKIGKNGYAYTSLYRDGEPTYSTVHRLIMLTFVGPRPGGLDICHRNGVRNDNRAENLYYGTRSENNLDKRAHGTDHNASKTHCKYGHEYDVDNTYWISGNQRRCKSCTSARALAAKTGTGGLLQGHALIGWEASGPGCGMCECGAASPLLSSRAKRRNWHREHKEHYMARSPR